MINPFQDAPEDLCRRVLVILDDLYDEEIRQLGSKPLQASYVQMLEMRVNMAHISTATGNLGWSSAQTAQSLAHLVQIHQLQKAAGLLPPVQVQDVKEPEPGPRRTWRGPWRKPRE